MGYTGWPCLRSQKKGTHQSYDMVFNGYSRVISSWWELSTSHKWIVRANTFKSSPNETNEYLNALNFLPCYWKIPNLSFHWEGKQNNQPSSPRPHTHMHTPLSLSLSHLLLEALESDLLNKLLGKKHLIPNSSTVDQSENTRWWIIKLKSLLNSFIKSLKT